MEAGTSYTTIRLGTECTGEIEDRKSRFIAQLAHVESEREADAFIAEVRSRHHDARHNVPAWILADGRERTSDDGEPRSTAGMPVLEVLRGADLRDVCCVVTRYFGGTLLGPGGLVRAYSGAATAAIEQAKASDNLCIMSLVVPVIVDIPYALYDRVTRMISDAGGKVRDSVFAEDVQLTCSFLTGEEVAFANALRDLVSGEEFVRVGEPKFGEF